jgi:hypothetical protein
MTQWFEIRVDGQLNPDWIMWVDGLTVVNEAGGGAIVRGPIADQAALHSVLARLGDLGLAIEAVNRVEPDWAYQAEVEGQEYS